MSWWQEEAEAAYSSGEQETWPAYIMSNLHSVVSGVGIQEHRPGARGRRVMISEGSPGVGEEGFFLDTKS
jgi:hypothetical protein